MFKRNQCLWSIQEIIQTPWSIRIFLDTSFFLNIAKISQILENFAKIANKFLGQNFLDTILGHRQNFTDTAWIVGPLEQAKRIFSWILSRHRTFLNIVIFLYIWEWLAFWFDYSTMPKIVNFWEKQVTKNSIFIKYQKKSNSSRYLTFSQILVGLCFFLHITKFSLILYGFYFRI